MVIDPKDLFLPLGGMCGEDDVSLEVNDFQSRDTTGTDMDALKARLRILEDMHIQPGTLSCI